jgi:nicotinamide mononucleotide transporter
LQVVAATLGLAGQYLVNRRSIRGYYLWIGANVVLIPVSAYAGLYVLSALYAVYLGLCVHGVVYWSRKADSVDPVRDKPRRSGRERIARTE